MPQSLNGKGINEMNELDCLRAIVRRAPDTLTEDTGWIAPQSAGAKDVGLPNYSAPAGFNGDDTVDLATLEALGTQLENLTRVVQALQTALANNLRPNA